MKAKKPKKAAAKPKPKSKCPVCHCAKQMAGQPEDICFLSGVAIGTVEAPGGMSVIVAKQFCEKHRSIFTGALLNIFDGAVKQLSVKTKATKR